MIVITVMLTRTWVPRPRTESTRQGQRLQSIKARQTNFAIGQGLDMSRSVAKKKTKASTKSQNVYA